MSPLTTFTRFQFGAGERFWALRQMGFAPRAMRAVPGLRFWRLLGTGRRFGGFAPDWGSYALIAVWDGELPAAEFWSESSVMRGYRSHACSWVSYSLATVRATGSWDKQQPFGAGSPAAGEPGAPIAVLTRATLRPSRQLLFWRHGDAVDPEIARAPGLLSAVAIGELPMLRSGTFSVWQSADAIASFSRQAAHQAAIRARVAEDMYAEELFCRFSVLATQSQGA